MVGTRSKNSDINRVVATPTLTYQKKQWKS